MRAWVIMYLRHVMALQTQANKFTQVIGAHSALTACNPVIPPTLHSVALILLGVPARLPKIKPLELFQAVAQAQVVVLLRIAAQIMCATT